MTNTGKRAGRLFVAALFCGSLALGSAGCGGVGCGAVVEPAVEVLVYDAGTGAPAAEGATGTLRDGGYLEAMRAGRFDPARPGDTSAGLTQLSLAGAEGRRGTYTVRIEKPGYEPWERRGVRATRDACGVTTTELRADLIPLRP